MATRTSIDAKLRQNPRLFRENLVIRSAHGPRRFGEIMAEFQRRDFKAMDAAFLALVRGEKPPIGRLWIERTKGGSKDSDLAVMMLWLLAFAERCVRIQIGAYDSDQADEIRLIVQEILAQDGPINEALASDIEVVRGEIRSRRTGSYCEILTTDSRGSHGSRPDVVLVNELSHVANQEFAETLLDNADKVPGGIVCIATNAGCIETWQHRWRQLAESSPRWYFSALTEPSPWISPEDLEESRRRNSNARFQRLWCGVWVRGAGDALDLDDIQASVTRPGPMDGTEKDYDFCAGLDLGIRNDRSALCVLAKHRTTQRIRLALCRAWAPGADGKVDLQAVQQGVLLAHQVFRLRAVNFDIYQADLMAAQLAAQKVPMVETAFVGKQLNEMATLLLNAFRQREVELYRDEALLKDLGRLTIEEKSYGYKLSANRTAEGHADRGTALALAILACHAMQPKLEFFLVGASRNAEGEVETWGVT